jgi:anti-sigma regulatory factor (Ser/Thr protein kinase)
VARARTDAARILGSWGVTERLDDMRLCLSEIATNALIHASPTANGASGPNSPNASAEFEVCLTLNRDSVLLEVHDSGGGHPTRRDPYPGDSNGRGLVLVDELADDWGIRGEPTGKTVWLLFKVGVMQDPPQSPAASLPVGPRGPSA